MNNQIKFIALGTRLKVLSENINVQLKKVFKAQNIEYEPRWLSILHILYTTNNQSIQQIAGSLGVTHPAVVQILNELIKKGYVTSAKGTNDRRTTYPALTENGRNIYLIIKPIVDRIEKIFFSHSSSTGYDIVDVLSKFEKVIGSKNLYDRVTESIKEEQMKEVKIIPFNKKYRTDFKKLNVEWLKEYFTVEPTDEKMLNNPEKEIIRKGGEVFFALYNDEVVGTCAMIKINEEVFELAKMAVTKPVQGKQVGRKLCLTAIGYAVTKNAKKIALDTNEKLTAAINLYRKLGFVVVPYQYEDKYERDLFRMELNLEGLKD
jgi:DNA-binding MarR family transcriptional regulator/GNAT superfamily N-acetyltransferase